MTELQYKFFEDFAKAKLGTIQHDCAKLAANRMKYYLGILDAMMEEMVNPSGIVDELVAERNSGIQDCRKLIKEWLESQMKERL